jgi:hypothetical protein
MKTILASSLLAAALLAGAGSLHAQVTLDTFSSFASPNTLFYGDWSQTGDPFSGSPVPIASFSQGVGVYNFANGSDADSAYVERSFAAPVNLGSNTLITLSLRLLAGDTADSVTVFLLDGAANTAFATFLTSSFTTTGLTTKSIAFTADPGFAANAVTSFRISGNDPFDSAILSVSLDNLAVTGAVVTPPPSAVPEPSTYGLAAAALLSGAIALARRKNRRRAPRVS